jgi:hypothetical protein
LGDAFFLEWNRMAAAAVFVGRHGLVPMGKPSVRG